MNKALKITLIASASTVGAGIISAISYVKGKKDGVALAHKQIADAELPRNTRRDQAAQA